MNSTDRKILFFSNYNHVTDFESTANMVELLDAERESLLFDQSLFMEKQTYTKFRDESSKLSRMKNTSVQHMEDVCSWRKESRCCHDCVHWSRHSFSWKQSPLDASVLLHTVCSQPIDRSMPYLSIMSIFNVGFLDIHPSISRSGQQPL